MRRIALLLVAVALLPAASAQARETNKPPKTNIASIVPLDSNPRTTTYAITIDAVDPDGVMSEMAVDFGNGGIVFAVLACADSQPGDPVSLTFDWTYKPGTYVVRAQGTSTPACFSGSPQESRTDEETLVVP